MKILFFTLIPELGMLSPPVSIVTSPRSVLSGVGVTKSGSLPCMKNCRSSGASGSIVSLWAIGSWAWKLKAESPQAKSVINGGGPRGHTKWDGGVGGEVHALVTVMAAPTGTA
jgi:hypothetical protein